MNNEIKERPILFSAPMVRAILDGRKSQTRRVVNRLRKFGSISGPLTEFGKSDTQGYDWHFRDKGMRWHDIDEARLLDLCPHGKIGDRLWVRETWQGYQRTSYEYDEWEAAESIKDVTEGGFLSFVYKADGENYPDKWFPSIHMPRIASRILLEITDVRVERLQDISEDDAIAEGVSNTESFKGIGVDDEMANRYAYRELWQSINGQGSWDINPWVWVIEFKRID